MNSNLFWCIVGIIGGAIVSYIFYILSKKRKILKYSVDTEFVPNSIIKKTGSKYPIYISQIVIKNTGNCTITNEDFIISLPLKIYFYRKPDGKFFRYSNCIPKNINITFNDDRSEATIHYRYIRPRQHICFTVLHTNHDIRIAGKIKDGKILYVKQLYTFWNNI